MKALLIIFLAGASAPLMPTQFDLACEGQLKIGLKRPEPYKFRYVVDVEQMKWCKNAVGMVKCPKVNPLVRVDETRYTFRESVQGESTNFDYVDRQTGNSFAYDSRMAWNETGECKVEPFSGFPMPKL